MYTKCKGESRGCYRVVRMLTSSGLYFVDGHVNKTPSTDHIENVQKQHWRQHPELVAYPCFFPGRNMLLQLTHG